MTGRALMCEKPTLILLTRSMISTGRAQITTSGGRSCSTRFLTSLANASTARATEMSSSFSETILEIVDWESVPT
jgi:hypothetical protein